MASTLTTALMANIPDGEWVPDKCSLYASLCEYSMASTDTPDKFPHIVYLVNRHRMKRITFVPRIFISMTLIYLRSITFM